MRATDEAGRATVVTRDVIVAAAPPVAAFSASDPTPAVGAETTLAAERPGAWDLDDDGEFDDATGAQAQRRSPPPAPARSA